MRKAITKQLKRNETNEKKSSGILQKVKNIIGTNMCSVIKGKIGL